jgi:peptidoglycan/LPS O-acetylase OafA/YrhL
MPSTTLPTTRPDTSVIDLLRGGMALWVFFAHLLYKVGVDGGLLSYGALPVDIFMLISGFLMLHYFRAREDEEPWQSPGTWRRFYVRRFFRVAPAYYVALLVALTFDGVYESCRTAVMTAFPPAWSQSLANDPSLRGQGLAPSNVLWHVSFLYGFDPARASNNILPDWSLSLEMQFYLAFPFLALALRRLGYVVVTIAGFWLATVSWRYVGVYLIDTPKLLGLFPQPTLLPLKIDCFLAGMLIAEGAYQWRRAASRAVLAIVAAAALSTYRPHWVFALCAAAMLVFVVVDFRRMPGIDRMLGMLARVFAHRSIGFVARTSYGLYLVHNLVLWPIAAYLTARGLASLPPLARVALLTVCTLPLAYALAWLLYRYVEVPGIELGKRLTSTAPAGTLAAP